MENCFLLPADESGRKIMDEAILKLPVKIGVTAIGKSIVGRDINAYFIGEGRRRVAFFGAHHAAESVTCNLLFAFMARFAERFARGEAKEEILFRSFTYVIVPAVNPDGIEIGMYGPDTSPLSEREKKMLDVASSPWQANARGVDLNHNYSYRFYEYKKIEKSREIYAGATLYSGEFPESEPETAAVMKLIRAYPPSGILSFHSQGEEIFHLSDIKLDRIADRLSRLSGYRPSSASDTAVYGGLCDYTSSIGIPSFTVEVGRGKNPLPQSVVRKLLSRLYPLMLEFPTFL